MRPKARGLAQEGWRKRAAQEGWPKRAAQEDGPRGRPKRAAQEGWAKRAARLAGWRRVTRQVWFCMRWTDRTACLFRTVPVALTGAARLRADGISICCYIVNVHNHPSWAASRKEGMGRNSSRPMPSLCTILSVYLLPYLAVHSKHVAQRHIYSTL
jgi:hypothetical protein